MASYGYCKYRFASSACTRQAITLLAFDMLDFGSGPHAHHDGLLCYLSICPGYCTRFVSRRDANGHWPIFEIKSYETDLCHDVIQALNCLSSRHLCAVALLTFNPLCARLCCFASRWSDVRSQTKSSVVFALLRHAQRPTSVQSNTKHL